MTIMLSIASWVLYQRGDRAAARDRAQQLVALAEAQGFVAWVDDGLAVLPASRFRTAPRRRASPRSTGGSRLRAPAAAWRNVIALCLVAEGYGKISPSGGTRSLSSCARPRALPVFSTAQGKRDEARALLDALA